jgi:hypothetical protein
MEWWLLYVCTCGDGSGRAIGGIGKPRSLGAISRFRRCALNESWKIGWRRLYIVGWPVNALISTGCINT